MLSVLFCFVILNRKYVKIDNAAASIRVGKELFIRLTIRVFHGRWSNFVCVLLSLLVLRVGCGM